VRLVIFHPQARDIIRRFPKDVRNRLGRVLYTLQLGELIGMPQSRPMPVVARNVAEMRLRSTDGSYRVFYYTAAPEGILVFHAFVKKSQRTPPIEIRLARKHLEELIHA
jgi:phage-related protein